MNSIATLWMILLLFVVLFMGAPIGFGLGFLSVLGILLFLQPNQLSQLVNIVFTQSTSSTVLMIPLFIFMAEVFACTGIGIDIFEIINRRLKKIKTNLGISSILASTIFSALCGSSPATAATIGTISIPAMLKKGYKPSFAAGIQAAGGTLGILIPPSISFAIYGIITETSIAKLFMAGLLPGIMLSIMFILFILLWTAIKGDLIVTKGDTSLEVEGERAKEVPFSKDLFVALPILLLIALILLCLYFGWATPTEVGGLGAVGAIIIGFLQGRLGMKRCMDIFLRTTRTSCMIMFIMFGGLSFVFVITSLGLPQEISKFIVSLSPNRWVTLISVNILLLILGCLLDPLGMVVITIPFLFPTLMAQGFDPVWLGVIITINVEVAMITPPVGLNLFVLKGVGNIGMRDVIKGSLPFVVILLLGMAILTIFPEIVLLLPSSMK
ncbi:MAG: TRAP transporter large permease [Syntrophorhabdaceae bacterium]|nr:TRAP transporter large permease [Syntrophorhabdaceae bacterium]